MIATKFSPLVEPALAAGKSRRMHRTYLNARVATGWQNELNLAVDAQTPTVALRDFLIDTNSCTPALADRVITRLGYKATTVQRHELLKLVSCVVDPLGQGITAKSAVNNAVRNLNQAFDQSAPADFGNKQAYKWFYLNPRQLCSVRLTWPNLTGSLTKNYDNHTIVLYRAKHSEPAAVSK